MYSLKTITNLKPTCRYLTLQKPCELNLLCHHMMWLSNMAMASLHISLDKTPHKTSNPKSMVKTCCWGCCSLASPSLCMLAMQPTTLLE
jgi:hypothetical protein